MKENFDSSKYSTAELLQMFIKQSLANEELYARLGRVTKVDKENATCNVKLINDAEYLGVRLQQVASTKGMLIVPQVNSTVLIDWVDSTTAYVAIFSEIDEIVFHGGSFGGLIKIDDLTKKINNFVDTFNNHTHTIAIGAINCGGYPNSAAVSVPKVSSGADSFDRKDFENTLITHGNGD